MAVSGQLINIPSSIAKLIIPRGFGGIRTTHLDKTGLQLEIIPRGFGGIRTTTDRFTPFRQGIIPRGFGGIRTTLTRGSNTNRRLYREDLAVSGQPFDTCPYESP